MPISLAESDRDPSQHQGGACRASTYTGLAGHSRFGRLPESGTRSREDTVVDPFPVDIVHQPDLGVDWLGALVTIIAVLIGGAITLLLQVRVVDRKQQK